MCKYSRPVETGGGGGLGELQAALIFTKIDILPIENGKKVKIVKRKN